MAGYDMSIKTRGSGRSRGVAVNKKGKQVLRMIDRLGYRLTAHLFSPVNRLLILIFRKRKGDGVLHISMVTHQPYVMTRHLRAQGLRADYLAKGESWLSYDEMGWDFRMARVRLPGPVRYLYEFWWAWRLYPKYEIVHSHFLQLIGSEFWELGLLKKMGKRIIFHFRGDDVRRKEINGKLNPGLNCCQECDYPESYCHDPRKDSLAELARKYGDLLLVTTPDLKDFVPHAIHFPFMLPELPGQSPPNLERKREEGAIKVLHVTNHEGLDGTRHIVEAVRRLREEGFAIDLVMPKRVPFQEMLRMYGEVDLTIGKLTMGYYANAQIESMYFGLPTMCYIREAFLKEIPDCPIINVRPETLFERLRYYLTHRKELTEIGRKGPEFVKKHHSGLLLAERLIKMYQRGPRSDMRVTEG
jgi:glycosyltransferase involved in cell wall biosynthesis